MCFVNCKVFLGWLEIVIVMDWNVVMFVSWNYDFMLRLMLILFWVDVFVSCLNIFYILCWFCCVSCGNVIMLSLDFGV